MDIYEDRKAQVFISYSKEDRALCANFIAQLTDSAIKTAAAIWYDRKLPPAKKWDEEIQAKLADADIVFVLASPSFLQSVYCMQRELPIIHGRQLAGRSAVRVVRLCECDLTAPKLADLTIWPEGKLTVEGLRDASRELDALRIWLKVEICKAIVARNADRYMFMSREEAIREREENPFGDHLESDNLSTLHDDLGESSATGREFALWGSIGGAVGAASGVALKAFFFPGALSAMRSLVFFAALGGIGGILKFVLRMLVLMLPSISPGDAKGTRGGLPSLSMFSLLTLASAVAGAGRVGLFIGLPICFVLSLGGWSFHLGLAGAAIAGAVLLTFAGLGFVQMFSPKRLKVFTDVRHLYRPPVVEPLPPPPSSDYRLKHHSASNPSRQETVAEFPALAADSDVRQNGNAEAGTNSALQATPVTGAGTDASDQPFEDDIWSVNSLEQVPLHLLLIGAAARAEDTAALKAAFEREASDMFQIAVVTDMTPEARDMSFWKRLTGRTYLPVLMTTELIQTSLPETIQMALSRSVNVYPVLVDRNLPAGLPLMDRQGLPTGRLTIAGWPVREVAWTNVSRTVLQKEAVDVFLARLDRYLETVFEAAVRDRYQKKWAKKGGHDIGDEIDLWKATRKETRFERVIDPRHDFAYYPFKQRAIHWSWRRAAAWGIAGALCFGTIRLGLVSSLGGSGSSALSALAFLLALGYLGLHDTLAYTRNRLRMYRDQSGVLSFLLKQDVFPLERGPVLKRTAAVLFLPLLLVLSAFCVSTIFQRQPDGGCLLSRFPHFTGAVIGLLCYASSRYRVPAVTVRRQIPPPYSLDFRRRGFRWTLRGPQTDRFEHSRGTIGGKESPLREPIAGASRQLSFSIWMIVRAFLDTIWLMAVGGAVLAAGARLGLPLWSVAPVSLYLVSVLIEWISRKPKPFYSGHEPKWRAWKRTMWYQVLQPAFRSMDHYVVATLVPLPTLLLYRKDEKLAWVPLLAFFSTYAIVTFSKRLFRQVAFAMYWENRRGNSE